MSILGKFTGVRRQIPIRKVAMGHNVPTYGSPTFKSIQKVLLKFFDKEETASLLLDLNYSNAFFDNRASALKYKKFLKRLGVSAELYPLRERFIHLPGELQPYPISRLNFCNSCKNLVTTVRVNRDDQRICKVHNEIVVGIQDFPDKEVLKYAKIATRTRKERKGSSPIAVEFGLDNDF